MTNRSLTKLKIFFDKISRNPLARPGRFMENRAAIVVLAFLVIYVVFVGRALVLTLSPPKSQKLLNIADRQYQKTVKLNPYRGFIYDRRKEALALSVLKPSLFVNPKKFAPTRKQAQDIARLLKISTKEVLRISNKSNYFSWLKRHADEYAAKRILNMDLKGLYLKKEPGRFYPTQSSAANLIGFVGIDNTGLSGLELIYDNLLKGEAAPLKPNVDARAKPIFLEAELVSPEKPGNNIHLTIDRAIQEIAEDALVEGVEKAEAKSGFVIVMDPHSGEILAMANYPTFNPNQAKLRSLKNTKNFALQNSFEPGSVVKPFVIAAALEHKLTQEEKPYNCEKGRYKIGPRQFIHDDHPEETLTTSEILIHSSNICTYKIAESLGAKGLYKEFNKIGFNGTASFLSHPGEARGYISKPDKWRPIRFANISFGQGFITTGLEIAGAFGAIANGGVLMQPNLISKITSPQGDVIKSYYNKQIRQVYSPKIAEKLKVMLARVVTEGTGSAAKTKMYSVAGKTGTAEKVDPELRAYAKDKRIASFAGFAPVEDPHIVVYVVIDEPKKKPYYGGVWAAPIFSKVVEQTLKYLNVKPDLNDETSPISILFNPKKAEVKG